MINNDFHPMDQGLEATDDHWGTENTKVADNWTPPRPANDNNDRGNSTIVNQMAKGRYPNLKNVITNVKFK